MIEPMKSINCTCDKCGYNWMPNGGIAPKVCPKCKSHNWNVNDKSPVVLK